MVLKGSSKYELSFIASSMSKSVYVDAVPSRRFELGFAGGGLSKGNDENDPSLFGWLFPSPLLIDYSHIDRCSHISLQILVCKYTSHGELDRGLAFDCAKEPVTRI